MAVIRRNNATTDAEKLRNNLIKTEVESKLGLTTKEQGQIDAIAKVQCAIAANFYELFKITSGSIENIRTVNEKIKQIRNRMKQLTQISKEPSIAELEEKIRKRVDPNQRISQIRTKEELEQARMEDDLEMVAVTRAYETEGIAHAFDKSMEKITNTLDEFCQGAKGDRNSIKWIQARLMIKIINKMSVEAVGIVADQYDPTNKIDLTKIAEDATRCPAMAYLEEGTIEEIKKIAEIAQTPREIEILGAIVDTVDLFEVELTKLEKCARAIREVEPTRELRDKIIKSVKALKGATQKEWLISQITKRPDMLKYYQERLHSEEVTELLFMGYLQFGQEKINGEEVFDKMKKIAEAKPEMEMRLVLALPQLVHYQIFEEVAQRIERNDESSIAAVEKIISKELDEALEALYPKPKADRLKEEGRIKTEETRTKSKQETEKIKLKQRRIILVSDETYGKQIKNRLNELVEGEVVLIEEENPSVKYLKSIVRDGDIVVIDASHIGHSKSGAAVIACRRNNIPYRIGKQTNAQRIIDGIKMAA